jgi:hypothetical protein
MYQGQYNVALFEILHYSYCFYLARSVTHSTSTKVFVVDMEAIIEKFLLSLYFQEWTHNYKNLCFVKSLQCVYKKKGLYNVSASCKSPCSSFQDEGPNDRKIGKLCEYISRNPMRVPKVYFFLCLACIVLSVT